MSAAAVVRDSAGPTLQDTVNHMVSTHASAAAASAQGPDALQRQAALIADLSDAFDAWAASTPGAIQAFKSLQAQSEAVVKEQQQQQVCWEGGHLPSTILAALLQYSFLHCLSTPCCTALTCLAALVEHSLLHFLPSTFLAALPQHSLLHCFNVSCCTGLTCLAALVNIFCPAHSLLHW